MRKPYLNLVVSLLLFISIGILEAQQLPDTPVDGNIVGGSETTIEQYPFQVAIYVDGIFQGGGVIIKDNTVLTAAHVVNRFDPSSHNITAVSGVTNRLTDFGPDRQQKRVGSYLIHPQYINYKGGYDIAILYLDTPFAINPKTKTIRIPSATDLQYIQPGVIAEVSGWGYTDRASETLPLNLMRLESSILGNDDSRLGYFGWDLPTSESILYTYLTPGSTYFKGACNYDSGGPLIVRTCNGEALLAGLVSFVFSNCQQGPTGFLRISSVRYWIADNTGINRDISLATSPYSFPQTVCATGATMQVGNLEPGYTVSWSVGNSLLYVQNTSGSGNNTATLYPTGNSSGWATVSAVVHSACGIYATLEKQVWVNNPTMGYISVGYLDPCEYYMVLSIEGSLGAANYFWNDENGNRIGDFLNLHADIVMPWVMPRKVYAYAQNPCGVVFNGIKEWETRTWDACSGYPGEGGCDGFICLDTYPNPASEFLTVSLNIDERGLDNTYGNTTQENFAGQSGTTQDAQQNENTVKQVILYNMVGQMVVQQTFKGYETQVDLGNIPKGVYVLRVQYKNHTNTKVVVVEK